MRKLAVLLGLVFASCASRGGGGEPTVVPVTKKKVMKAGFGAGKDLPAERNGVKIEYTGAIMFVCSNSDKHADQEVLIRKCPGCSQKNYFYWDHDKGGFKCYACVKPVPNAVIKCPDCGKPPRRVRTRNTRR